MGAKHELKTTTALVPPVGFTFHPEAMRYPRLSEQKQQMLALDIKANGLRPPEPVAELDATHANPDRALREAVGDDLVDRLVAVVREIARGMPDRAEIMRVMQWALDATDAPPLVGDPEPQKLESEKDA